MKFYKIIFFIIFFLFYTIQIKSKEINKEINNELFNNEYVEVFDFSGKLENGYKTNSLNMSLTTKIMWNSFNECFIKVEGTYYLDKEFKDHKIDGEIFRNGKVELKEINGNGVIQSFFYSFVEPKKIRNACNKKTNLVIENFNGNWTNAFIKNGSNSINFFKLTLRDSFYKKISTKNKYGRYYIAGFKNDEELETYSKNFQEAVYNKDKFKVVDQIFYPVNVKINNKRYKFNNSNSLLEKYNNIFTKTFVSQIREIHPHNMFVNSKGVMMGNGEIWFAYKKNRIGVLSINN